MYHGTKNEPLLSEKYKKLTQLETLLNEPILAKRFDKVVIKKLTLSTLYHFLAKFFRPRIVL